MEQLKDGAMSNGKNNCPPSTPSSEPWSALSLPALPPSFLSTLDPTHLGLPEHLASVTVPVRLDTLSYLLHSALLGTYNLQQSLAPCSCASQPGHTQSDTAAGWPSRGRGRGRWRGGWDTQRRPHRSQRQAPWGPGRAQQQERSVTGGPGADHQTSPGTLPDQNRQREAGREELPLPPPPPVTEDWEADY